MSDVIVALGIYILGFSVTFVVFSFSFYDEDDNGSIIALGSTVWFITLPCFLILYLINTIYSLPLWNTLYQAIRSIRKPRQ